MRDLAGLRGRLGFHLIGNVVMPEHVHLLMSEPAQGTPSTLLHDLKLRVARRLRQRRSPTAGQMPLVFGELGGLRAFWQARFYDFNVYTEKKKREKLEYMNGNPVTRGLVSHPKDWPWSSWSNYAEGQGLIQVDLV